MKCEKFKVRLKTKQPRIKVKLSKKCINKPFPDLLSIYNKVKNED